MSQSMWLGPGHPAGTPVQAALQTKLGADGWPEEPQDEDPEAWEAYADACEAFAAQRAAAQEAGAAEVAQAGLRLISGCTRKAPPPAPQPSTPPAAFGPRPPAGPPPPAAFGPRPPAGPPPPWMLVTGETSQVEIALQPVCKARRLADASLHED
jgi:hypothetical protein